MAGLQECKSKQMVLEWKKGSSPFPSTTWKGCMVCDDKVQPMCVVKHGRAFVARRGRGGRGRGRRGRGRERGRKDGNPLMSFSDF